MAAKKCVQHVSRDILGAPAIYSGGAGTRVRAGAEENDAGSDADLSSSMSWLLDSGAEEDALGMEEEAGAGGLVSRADEKAPSPTGSLYRGD